MAEQPDWQEFTPPFAGRFILFNLAWIFFAIFQNLDSNGWIYTGVLAANIAIGISILRYSRREEMPISGGQLFFFFLIWLGISAFANGSRTMDYIYFSLTLQQLNALLLLPLVLVWIIPYNSENFFGLQEVSEKLWIKSIWKVSIIIILLLKTFQLSIFWEFLVLIPLVIEPASLYNKNKEEMPLLTLHIQKELMNTFAVPLSMLKGLLMIMVSFVFELLNGNLWLLVILGYFAAAFIWFIDFIIPQSMRESGKERDPLEEIKKEIGNEEFEKIVKEEVGELHRRMEKKSKDEKDKLEKKVRETVDHFSKGPDIDMEEILEENDLSNENIDNLDITPVELIEKMDSDDQNKQDQSTQGSGRNALVKADDLSQVPQLDEDASINEKAHALGRKVRAELQKPQYNLNHILSTLSKEDFSSAFRVPHADLIFESTEGPWSPPKDLILFPIELEEYDYRRTDEILLLGFNRPIANKSSNFNVNFGDDSKYNTKISGNQIQIGDTTFHMKTLVLTGQQWEEAKQSLEVVEDVDDISYTGFTTLHDLQDKLAAIAEKWILLRKKAEEATINFVAGLLGSRDPIFMGREDIAMMIEEANNPEYEIEDAE